MLRKGKVDNKFNNIDEKKLHPYIIAKNKIKFLKIKNPKSQIEAGTFYSELTYIVKEFLENQFFIKTIEMTTDEIKHNKKMIGFDNNGLNKIIKVLERADLIKFAKLFPSENDINMDLTVVDQFLDNQKINL